MRGKAVCNRLLAFVLSGTLALQGCNVQPASETQGSSTESTKRPTTIALNDDTHFNGLGDTDLHQYVQDSIYAQLENELGDDYQVGSVQAIYVSGEYLEELSYNSRENIYFGYSLNELEDYFQGSKYVFSFDEDGQTTVHAFDGHTDDTFNEVIKNVSIGTGVILVCVTVSAVTAGSAPTVSAIFAASAVNATKFAASSAALGGAAATLVSAVQTGNPEEALRQGALAASEDFKWGAITGAITGGLDAAGPLYYARSVTSIPTYAESENLALAEYGGEKQISYLAGKRVTTNTVGSTRPDLSCVVDGHMEAIEVKNYDLASAASRSELRSVLRKQVADRVENLPAGSTQRIVLSTQGRGYSTEFTNAIVEWLQESLADIYPDIPVDVMA